MITPGEIGTVLLMVILWTFVAFIWVVTYTFYQDLNEWRDVVDIADYITVAFAGVASMALTILLALLTLCAMGIVEG